MLNEKVCLAYINNSRSRRSHAAHWSIMFEAMPIGVPLTASEVAEKGSQNVPFWWWSFNYRSAAQMLHAMLYANNGCIKREEIPCDPYEIEVEHFAGWDSKTGERVYKMKKITIDHKVVFTRLI